MFTFTNPRALTPEESSPYNNLLSNALKNYQQIQQAQFLRPSLEEQLKKSQLFNQYYGPDIESQMALRGAQAGHLGATTTGENIKNKYLAQSMQAEIADKIARANKTKMIQQMMQQILSGNQPSGYVEQNPLETQPQMPANKPGHMTPHGFEGSLTGVPAQDLYANTGPDIEAEKAAINRIEQSLQKQEQEKKNEKQNITYPQAALMSQLLGLGQPKIVDIDGKKTAITPFGNIEVGKGL